jgi:SNF2 family DNA or RNA helicase
VGLNLTAASRIYLMDPVLNPATEDQCVNRCHRLGQKRDVVITKFIVKDSVGENMVGIQRQKQDLLEKALHLHCISDQFDVLLIDKKNCFSFKNKDISL